MTETASDNERLSCSVVIATSERPEELERCLEAVALQDYPGFDVIVVDNSAGDARTEAVARRFGARYITEPRRGLCRARNRGALVSGAKVIAYLDDDSVPEPEWLSGIVDAFRDPLVMAVSGKTIPLRVESESERLFAEIRGDAYSRREPRVVSKETPFWFEICGFGGIGAGCNMAVRRAAFEVWPGFHERIGRGTRVYGGDEQHAFLSLVSRGFKVAYTPHSIVRHPIPATMELLRTRYLKDLTSSTAFLTMMLVEESQHRRSTLRYIWQAFGKAERGWRGNPAARPRVASRLRSAYALLLGPLKYFQGVLVDNHS